MTKAELTAMARRKKITMHTGMLKGEMVKAIKKGLRKIEALKRSKPATRKQASPKRAKASPAEAGSRRVQPALKKAVRETSPVKVKAKKKPAKKTAVHKPKTPTAKTPDRTTTTKRKPKVSRPAKAVQNRPAAEPEETLWELPASYNDHRLVVMARDPNWAYAYWDLDPQRVRDLLIGTKQTAGKARWMLRVYSAEFPSELEQGHYFDIAINGETRSYYLNLSRPGSHFIVEIGIVNSSGFFRALAQSNPVLLPLDHPSETAARQTNPALPTAVFPVALN